MYRVRNAVHYQTMAAFIERLKAAQYHQHEKASFADNIAELMDAFATEEENFKITQKSEKTIDISTADYNRDRDYGTISTIARKRATNGKGAVKTAAVNVVAVLDKYSVNVNDTYWAETGVMSNLIQELEALSEDMATLGLADDLTSLKQNNKIVSDLIQGRQDDKAFIAAQALKSARVVVDNWYQEVCDDLAAIARYSADANMQAFIVKWNAMVGRIKDEDIYTSSSKEKTPDTPADPEAEPSEE